MIREGLLVVLGGLFGYVLSQLPKKWVYATAAVALVLVILNLEGALR